MRIFSIGIRRRPTLPGRVQPSTIGAEGLNFCVRDGNRWDPFAIATGNCIKCFRMAFAFACPCFALSACWPISRRKPSGLLLGAEVGFRSSYLPKVSVVPLEAFTPIGFRLAFRAAHPSGHAFACQVSMRAALSSLFAWPSLALAHAPCHQPVGRCRVVNPSGLLLLRALPASAFSHLDNRT